MITDLSWYDEPMRPTNSSFGMLHPGLFSTPIPTQVMWESMQVGST